jgi:uncharacterized membrane protein
MAIVKKRIFYYLIFLAFSVIILDACRNKTPDAMAMDKICFDTQVLPIFQNKCAVCHNTSDPVAGLVFSDYTSIMKSITPGDPNKSVAYNAIVSIFDGYMPPDQPLTIEERTLIRLWIEQGANQTICYNDSVPIDTIPEVIDTTTCFSRDILPILLSSCALSDCHDNITHQEDINFSSYNSFINNGEVVDPFNPLNSKMYEVLLQSGEDQMPPLPASRLSNEQIQLIYDWINEGALNEADCPVNCDTSIFTYSGAISGIISNNCKGCHSGALPSGGVSLTTYDQVRAVALDGRLVNVVNGANGKPLMPPTGSLNQCRITQIEKWVSDGAQNNK